MVKGSLPQAPAFVAVFPGRGYILRAQGRPDRCSSGLPWERMLLLDRTYRPGPYHSFYIHEPKTRMVREILDTLRSWRGLL
jgi:hypothetical protein